MRLQDVQISQEVEVQDAGGNWHPGRVTKICTIKSCPADEVGHAITVQWVRDSRRISVVREEGQIRRPVPTIAPKFAVGDEVEVIPWRRQPGHVVQVEWVGHYTYQVSHVPGLVVCYSEDQLCRKKPDADVIKQLREELESTKRDLQTTCGIKISLLERAKVAEARVAELEIAQPRVDDLRTRIKQLEHELADAKLSLTNMRGAYERDERLLENAGKDRAEFETRIASLKRQLQAKTLAEPGAEELRKERDALRESVAELKQQFRHIQAVARSCL